MSPDRKDDSFAANLEATRWEYSQRDDRRFLLDPIGQIFGSFCWDGQPEGIDPRKRSDAGEDEEGS